ncbi:MAG: DUF4838 domain-containing protein [Candidatus Hydrogenedentes bacterium]|nr:DUF4838 domain-containing protein [Candidatus Hydrogenedentota bacterium]
MRVFVCISLVSLASVVAAASDKGAGIPATELKDWAIVVAPDAIPSEKSAAEEFQSLFKQCTGTDLRIVDRPAKKRAVLIGIGAQGKSEAATPESVERLGDEGLSIVVERNVIRIAGGRPRGILYGVYEFFERYFGVRFLTHDHTHIPPGAGQTVIPLDIFSYVPPFSFRCASYKENSDHPDFAARLRMNTFSRDEKLGGATPQNLISHSFLHQISADEYGKTHPEYFALVEGVRKLDVSGISGRTESQPCVTNHDVLDIVTANVLKQLDASPGMRNISVSQNDNDEYCHCPACEAINQREETPMGAHLAFVNAVAERVEKKYPRVKVGTLAYAYTRKAPKTIKPRPNVQIQLCSIECCTLHPIDDPDCPKNRKFFQDVMAWKAICNDVWMWNYNTDFSYYDLPFPNLRAIAPNVRFFAENNAKGVFMQTNGQGNAGEMCDLRNYVIARCLWNPRQDGWALVNEFCALHYGNAGPPILDYLEMLHDTTEASGSHPDCYPTPEVVGLTPEISRKILGYFDQALALADSDAVRARVEKASICAYRAVLTTVARPWRYEDGVCRVDIPAGMRGVPSRYAALCKTYGMSMSAENVPVEVYLEQVKRFDTGYPAVKIENSVWRLLALPEEDGKIVSMFHKPTGRELLAATTHPDILRGTHEDLFLTGLKKGTPLKYTATVKDSRLELRLPLGNDATFVRRVELKSSRPNTIFFESTLTNCGAEPATYQFKAHPEFNPASTSDKPEVIAGYVKNAGSWTQFNRGWHRETGPDRDLLRQAKDGAFAFYSHEARFGVQVNYRRSQLEYPYFWWWPDWPQVNLELFTPKKELKKGEAMTLTYEVRYLAEVPK